MAFCTVAYLVLGESIVGALFGWGAFDADDTRAVALVLAAYSLGLPAVASSRIFQNTLYAVGDTSGPARIAAARVGLAAVVGIALMFPLDRIAAHGGALLTLDGVGWFGPLNAGIRTGSPDPHLGAVGLALGSACAAWLELALLSRRCRRSVDGTSGPTAVMSRLAPATGAAVVVALGVRWATDGLPAIAAAPIGLAVAGCTYVLVASATGVDEADLVIGPLRRHLRR